MPDKVTLTPEEIQALVQSGDLTTDIAMAKLSPPSLAIYNKLAVGSQPGSVPFKDGSRPDTPPDPHALGILGTSIAVGLMGAPMIAGGVGALVNAAKPILGYTAAGYGVHLGKQGGIIPPELANVLQTALGWKAMMGGMGGGAGKAAAAEAAVLSKEEKIIAEMVKTKQYSPEQARTIVDRMMGKAAGPAGPNVIKEGPLSGNPQDVMGGVQNDFRGAVGFDKPGGVSDPAAFDRALQGEMGWIAKQKGKMPSGSGNAAQTDQDYNAWSAAQDAKFPQKPLGDLINDFGASLKRRTPK